MVHSALFAPAGGRILTASADTKARLWDRDGKPLASLHCHTSRVTSAVFAQDGGGILTASVEQVPRPKTQCALTNAAPPPDAMPPDRS